MGEVAFGAVVFDMVLIGVVLVDLFIASLSPVGLHVCWVCGTSGYYSAQEWRLLVLWLVEAENRGDKRSGTPQFLLPAFPLVSFPASLLAIVSAICRGHSK